jgi:predicted nucleic acid-binding protein
MNADASVWHCFLDTNTLHPPYVYEDRKRVAELARGAATKIYLPETVVIECRNQLLRKGHDRSEIERLLREATEPFDSVLPIPDLPLQEIRDLVEILAAEKADFHFRDATIFLTSRYHAVQRGFTTCMMVTNDKKFRRTCDLVTRSEVAKWLFVSGLNDLCKVLEAHPAIAAKLQAFMETQEEGLLTLVEHHHKREMIDAINAEFPGAADASTPMIFRGMFAVPEQSGPPSLVSFEFGVDLYPSGMEHVTIYLTGRALVRFEGGEFVGTPDIQGPLEVGRPSF